MLVLDDPLPQKLIRTSRIASAQINTRNFCRGNRMPARRANSIQRRDNLCPVDLVLMHRRIIYLSPFV